MARTGHGRQPVTHGYGVRRQHLAAAAVVAARRRRESLPDLRRRCLREFAVGWQYLAAATVGGARTCRESVPDLRRRCLREFAVGRQYLAAAAVVAARRRRESLPDLRRRCLREFAVGRQHLAAAAIVAARRRRENLPDLRRSDQRSPKRHGYPKPPVPCDCMPWLIACGDAPPNPPVPDRPSTWPRFRVRARGRYNPPGRPPAPCRHTARRESDCSRWCRPRASW